VKYSCAGRDFHATIISTKTYLISNLMPMLLNYGINSCGYEVWLASMVTVYQELLTMDMALSGSCMFCTSSQLVQGAKQVFTVIRKTLFTSIQNVTAINSD
jgi:hypothetical protein